MDWEFTDSYTSRPVELPLGREGGGRRGERMGEEEEIATCFNLSKQKYCITFSPFCLWEPYGERGVGFCAAIVLWPVEWSSGKPEWAGGGAISSIKCHSVSSTGVYFLFICRMRDIDTSLSVPSSSHLVLPTSLSLVFVFLLGFSANFITRARKGLRCFLRLLCPFQSNVQLALDLGSMGWSIIVQWV